MTEPITDVKDEAHMSWLSSASLPWIGLSTAEGICAQEAFAEEKVPSNSLHLTSGCCISYFVLLWLHTMTKATDRKTIILAMVTEGASMTAGEACRQAAKQEAERTRLQT